MQTHIFYTSDMQVVNVKMCFLVKVHPHKVSYDSKYNNNYVVRN
jgi:hypothetical protein